MEIQFESNAAPDSRARVKVSIQNSKHYKKIIEEFQKQYQDQQAQFNYSEEYIYYIVSTDFLNTWRDFCLSHQETRLVPIKMNASLFMSCSRKLRLGLRENQDLQFLSEKTYKLLEEFHCNQLKRNAVKLGNQKRIPIYLNDYQYVCITNADLKSIDQKLKKRDDFKLKIIEQSQNAVVKDMTLKIMQKQMYGTNYQARLWRVDKKQNIDSLYKYLKAAADRATYEYRIKGFGKRLDFESKIQDLQMQQGDFFVVQIKDKNKKWYLQTENQKKCQGCYDIAELKFPCQCQKVAYCSQQCKQKDKRFHLRLCKYAQLEQLNKPVQMKLSTNSARGLVGLRNLGNTCFMNSCLQCLSNTQPLTNYFLANLYDQQINKTNVLGTKGKLAKSYAKFIKGMWCQSEHVYTPDGIKSAVSSINPMFLGYAQHDSQQFFSFLIDGLHQDLNRVQKKPYVQSVQSNNKPDHEIALSSWIAHLKRNQSIITDLMAGQYKSKVTCPTCRKDSITFDPFITVTLPIPQKVVNIFQGYFIYSNFESKTKKISFTYNTKPNVQQWCRKISEIVDVKPERMQVYLVSMKEGIYKAGRDSLSQIVYKTQNQNKNIFIFQLTQQQIEIKQRIQLTTRLSKKNSYYTQYDNAWFKFPFFFQKQGTDGLTIYKRILKFLFNQTYNDSKNTKMIGGKSYQDYQALMLKNRPFQLYFRHGKRLDRYYNKLEYKFDEQTVIRDKDLLSDFLSKIDEKDLQLDVRFQKDQTHFNLQKLKDLEDLSKKQKVQRDYGQDTNHIELTSCFEEMRQPEQLEAGNQWYCPSCKQHKQATKQLSIYRAPKILILHLKRFKQKGLVRKEKNESKVNFPATLNMKQFLINPSPMSSYNQQIKTQQIILPSKYQETYKISSSDEPIYDLYAISNHYGGLGGGHYTAYCKNAGKWYEFNDSSCRSVSEGSISGHGAYILFYKRRD